LTNQSKLTMEGSIQKRNQDMNSRGVTNLHIRKGRKRGSQKRQNIQKKAEPTPRRKKNDDAWQWLREPKGGSSPGLQRESQNLPKATLQKRKKQRAVVEEQRQTPLQENYTLHGGEVQTGEKKWGRRRVGQRRLLKLGGLARSLHIADSQKKPLERPPPTTA